MKTDRKKCTYYTLYLDEEVDSQHGVGFLKDMEPTFKRIKNKICTGEIKHIMK